MPSTVPGQGLEAPQAGEAGVSQRRTLVAAPLPSVASNRPTPFTWESIMSRTVRAGRGLPGTTFRSTALIKALWALVCSVPICFRGSLGAARGLVRAG